LCPVRVIAHRQRHPDVVVDCGVDALHESAAPIPCARLHVPVHRVLDDGLGGHARRNLELRDLDELTFACAAQMLKRGEQSNTGVHPDDRIGWSLQVARRAVGVAGCSRHPRCPFEVECPADVITPRPLQPEPGHAHEDHVRIELYK
jgi:hypothetical protein